MGKGNGSKRSVSQNTQKINRFITQIRDKGELHDDDWLAFYDLSASQQEEILRRGEFTGATLQDDPGADLFIPISKNDIVRTFQDSLVNEMQGYPIKDEFYDVVYKDGSAKSLREDENDFANAGITNNMMGTAYTKAKAALHLRDVAGIVYQDSMGSYIYVAKGGKNAVRKFGYDLWEKGKKN